MESVILSGEEQFKDIYSLLHHAIRLAGHDHPQEYGRWVMSSYNGQVIFPSLYETLEINKEGFLTLSWLPGIIRYRDQVHNQICFPDLVARTGRLEVLKDMPVIGPCFLVPSLRLVWRIAYVESGLSLSLGLEGDGHTWIKCSARKLMQQLASALIVEACEHEADTALEIPDPDCLFTSPLTPVPEAKNMIGVVPVDKSDDFRFATLTSVEGNTRFVVRKRACLSCCLNVCKTSSANVLIL